MARVSTQLLDELVREAEVLSAIKADIPNSWKILEHEIGRARAAAAAAAPADPASAPRSSLPLSSNPLPSLSLPTSSTHLPSHNIINSNTSNSSRSNSSNNIHTKSSNDHHNSLPPSLLLPNSSSSSASSAAAPAIPLSPAPSLPSLITPVSAPASAASAALAAPHTPLASATTAAVTAAAAVAAAAVADGTSSMPRTSSPTSSTSSSLTNNATAGNNSFANTISNNKAANGGGSGGVLNGTSGADGGSNSNINNSTNNTNDTSNNTSGNGGGNNNTSSSSNNNSNNNNNSSSNGGGRHPIRKRVKLRVPAEQYPDYNFVGRLLGPRGATLKRLERDTGCRIMIRGKGSIRKDKEAEVRGKPGWEHVFHEALHVVIEVVDAPDEPTASRTLTRAKDLVEMLLVPVPEERDSLKRAQLRDLAILNGTHRSVSDLLGPSLHPFPITPSRSPPPPSPPPLRRAASQTVKPVSASLYQSSSEPFSQVFDPAASPFARQPSQSVFSSPAPPPSQQSSSSLSHQQPQQQSQQASQRVPPSLGGVGNAGVGGMSSNPSASADSLLPGLEKLRIPALEFDALNEPNLSSPFPMPLPSPTIVDPEIYPYPPTPGLVGMDQQQGLGAFTSPTWNPRSSSSLSTTTTTTTNLTNTNPSASLPPRSPPVPSSNPSPSPSAFLLGRASDGGGGMNRTQQHQHQHQQQQAHSHGLFQRELNKTSSNNNLLDRDFSESPFSNHHHLSSFLGEDELPSLSEFGAAAAVANLSRMSSPPPTQVQTQQQLRRAGTPSPPAPSLPLSPPPPSMQGGGSLSPFVGLGPSGSDAMSLSTLFTQGLGHQVHGGEQQRQQQQQAHRLGGLHFTGANGNNAGAGGNGTLSGT